MIEVWRDDQQSRIFLAHGEFVDPAIGRGIDAPVKDRDLDQPAHHEQPIGAPLMQAPSPDPAGKGGGDMDLNHRPANNVPTRACDLGDMAIFVRNRSRRAKSQVMNWGQPKLALLVDRRLLGQQLLAANNVGRNGAG